MISRIFFLLLFSVFINAYAQENTNLNSTDALSQFKYNAKSIATDAIAQIPVQDHGRIKPFDTFARESILFLSGKYRFEGLNPIQTYFALIVTAGADQVELINVRDPLLRVKLGHTKNKRYFSIKQLETSPLEQLARPLVEKQEKNSKSISPEEKNILEAFQQYWFAKNIQNGTPFFEALILSPESKKSEHTQLTPVFENVKDLFKSIADHDVMKTNLVANDLNSLVRNQAVPDLFKPFLEKTSTEVFFNKTQLFFFAGILYMLLGTFILTGLANKKLKKPILYTLLSLPLMLHFVGFALRVYISGFAPVTNMYGTMVWMSFGVVIFGTFLFVLYQNSFIFGLLLMGASATLLLTESIPLVLSPDLDPIVAVLRNNFWLTIHVLTITISYAAFTIAMLIGNAGLIKSIVNRNKPFEDSEYKEMAHSNYRAIQLGVFLLTTGIILGGWWADYSWGRFWGWDPKETWALIADLGFLAILHGRYVGWVGNFGILATAPIAYLLVVMAWYGVNFILAAGLHSYGFSSGGAQAVAIFVAAQLILFAVSMYFNHKRILIKRAKI